MAEARVTTATGTTGLREVTIAFPPGLPLLSLNGRLHWAARNKAAQALKQAAWAIVASARVPPMERAVITVEYQPPDKRRRDPGNYAATGKPLIDGLVAAGLLPDDDGAHVAGEHYRIGPLHPLHPRGRIVLHVREVREAPAMAGDDSISGD